MKKSVLLSSLLFSCFLIFSIAAGATAPVVTTNPVPDTVCSGTTAKFFVAVNDTTTGATPVGYSWQVSTDGGATWSYITDVSPYSGSSTDTLFVAASIALNGYQYRSVDTNNDGADTSIAAWLAVDTLNAGTIAGGPAICVGSSVALTDAVPGGFWSHVNHVADTLSPLGLITGWSAGFDTVKYVVSNVCGTAIAMAAIRVDIVATALSITGPTVTCVGHTIDLMNANVLGSGTWSVSNTSASITSSGVLSGLHHGMDTVTYAFTNGCNSVSSSAVIEVDTPLSAGVISGEPEVCAGSWTSLSETVTGGVWISGSSTAVVDGSGNVTGISSGTASISYVLSNDCGSSIATYTVTVSALAGPITGSDSVGVDSSIVLSNSAPGGIWTVDSTGDIAVVDSAGVVTGVAVGSTTVTYTVTNLCGTSSSVMILYVGMPPSAGFITGSDSVCIGGTIPLADTLAPGGVWTSSQDTLGTIDPVSGVVTGISAGFVIITYTVHSAFGSNSATHVVFITGRPVIRLFPPAGFIVGSNTIIAYPYGGTFSETNSAAGTFVGFSEGSDSSGSYVSALFIGLLSGSNTIHYTVNTACGDADSSVSFKITEGVIPVNGVLPVLSVYPNPNTGEFTLNLASPNAELVSVVITNIVGEKVKELTVPANTPANIKLDQPAGIYFVTVSAAAGKYTAKINITN